MKFSEWKQSDLECFNRYTANVNLDSVSAINQSFEVKLKNITLLCSFYGQNREMVKFTFMINEQNPETIYSQRRKSKRFTHISDDNMIRVQSFNTPEISLISVQDRYDLFGVDKTESRICDRPLNFYLQGQEVKSRRNTASISGHILDIAIIFERMIRALIEWDKKNHGSASFKCQTSRIVPESLPVKTTEEEQKMFLEIFKLKGTV